MTSRDAELRARVLRLIRGEFRSEDITHLLLSLRFRAGGHQIIREIGDFVSHPDERDKGVVTTELADFFKFYRLFEQIHGGNPVDYRNAPADFPDVIRGNFRRMRATHIKRDTGFKQPAAKRVLDDALNKFVLDSNGSYCLQTPLTPNETKILDFCLSCVVNRSIMTEYTIFDDFIGVLRENKLIDRQEEKSMGVHIPGFALYVMARMHNACIKMEEGWEVRLSARIDNAGCLDVNGVGTAFMVKGRPVQFAVPLLLTTLFAEEWCSKELLDDPICRAPPGWSYALEVSGEPKLVKL